MPLGPYETWDECIEAQKRKGRSDKSARRICGHIEKMTKKEHKE
jgi:hypothetical protein